MSDTGAPSRRWIFEQLLKNEQSLFVHLDARVPGVVVPSKLSKDFHVVLEIGLSMPVPIADLEVTEEGVKVVLSFGRNPFLCSWPWKAVYFLSTHDGLGAFFPDDMPPEARERFRVAVKARPKLQVLNGWDEDESKIPGDDDRPRPQLKLVK